MNLQDLFKDNFNKQGVAEGSLEEYGDTARGQKQLTRAHKRAVDRTIRADDKNRLEPDVSKRDLKTVRKNSATADRAWERMSDKDLDEASVYKKDQDLSSVSTQELEAFVRKHWFGGVPTYGQGESVKRAMRELRRRQKQGVAEGDYDIRKDPTYQKYNPETHAIMYKDGKHKLVKHDQVAKAKSLGWKVRSSLKAFAKSQGGVAEGSLNEFVLPGGGGGDNYGGDLHDILMAYISRNEPELLADFGEDEIDSVVADMVTMGMFDDIDPNNEEDLYDALDKIIDILNDDLPEQQGVAETALNPKSPVADLEAKRKALQDLERQPGADLAAIRQRKLELEKEARAKGLVKSNAIAESYNRLKNRT